MRAHTRRVCFRGGGGGFCSLTSVRFLSRFLRLSAYSFSTVTFSLTSSQLKISQFCTWFLLAFLSN